MTDITRETNLMQKKSTCYFAGPLKEGTEDGDLAVTSDDYLLGYLPPDSIVTDAYVHVETASDAATSAAATLGTASAGTEILSAADLKATGEQGTFTGQSLTGSGVPVWLGVAIVGAATAVGEYVVVVEYLEYNKTTGEYTKLS